MKRLVFLISLLCLAIFLFQGSTWAHGSSKHKLRPSSDIRNSGEITAKIDFCGAAGANGAEVDIVGHSFSATSGPTGKVNLQYIPKGCYTLRVRIKDQPEYTEPVCVKKRFITDMGTISLCSDNDGDGFTPDIDPLAANGNDCNDNNPTINPDALELCDGIDNNCDGITDGEGCTACTDSDSDGFFAQDGCGTPVDCDDTNNTVRPFAEEICDGADNNCEGTTDEGFDFDNDPDHCGGCGIVCAGTCAAGICSDGDGDGIEPPEDCDDTNPNVFPGAVELCDGIDNNCDGSIDEGNPGGNIACTTSLPGECASGVTACQSGALVCEPAHPPIAEICDGLDNNCDGVADEGGVCVPVCGNGAVDAGEACDDGGESAACNSDCTVAVCGDGQINTTANEVCDDSGESATCNANCKVSACGDGTLNTTAGETCDDGNTVGGDGCSATCQDETAADEDGDGFTVAGGDCNDADAAINPSAADLPDSGFVDSNCDGIDGDEARAVFVSAATGNNAAPGTKAAPVQTIGQGLVLAGGGKDHVYISDGTYNESVNLVNGVSMWGSFSASNSWSRSLAFQTNIVGNQVILSTAVIGLRGVNITSSTTVADLHISTPNVSATGVTNYGIHCSNCDGLMLLGNHIDAGNGGPGVNGVSGTPGASGGNGSNGEPGDGDNDNVNAFGGSGGSSSCGVSGGNGGRGGQGSQNGQPGSNGVGVLGGSGGSGGSSGGTDGGNPGSSGSNGLSGSNDGANGSSGNGNGIVGGNFWQGIDGGNGTNGQNGSSGGGGGGGGGQSAFFAIDGTGNGGGGGGAGGCGGTRGLGGTAGGGSFGLFLVNSTGVTLSGNTITSGNGGRGGNGGTGRQGGAGGSRGLGATVDTDDVGAGGNGGNGSDGGRGGHGAGGAGGVSFAIGLSNTSVNTAGNTLSPRSGGSGGPSPGTNGASGASGLTRNF